VKLDKWASMRRTKLRYIVLLVHTERNNSLNGIETPQGRSKEVEDGSSLWDVQFLVFGGL